MTNTKFRKRALLSSVAMLLVALVALGSATFAWFVDDPTADAKGLAASAQSATGLQIATDSSGLTNFSHHAAIAKGASAAGGVDSHGSIAITGINLSPAIFNKSDKKFYSIKASAASGSAADTSMKWSSVNANRHVGGDGVYHEKITLRVTGTTAADQTITITGVDLGLTDNVGALTGHQNMEQAVTVLITDGASTYYTYSKASRVVPCMNKTITTTGEGTTYSAPADADKFTTTTAAASGLSGDTFTISAGTNETKTLDLYVYLDGTHDDVFSDNATSLTSLITKCDLYFQNTTT